MSGNISQFLDEQRLYILEEKRRLGILEKAQCIEKEVCIKGLDFFQECYEPCSAIEKMFALMLKFGRFWVPIPDFAISCQWQTQDCLGHDAYLNYLYIGVFQLGGNLHATIVQHNNKHQNS